MLRGLGPGRSTLASALLVAAALPPWDLDFFVWVALVPWLAGVARRPTAGQAIAQGLWLGAGIGLLAAHWVAYAAHEFLELAWPLAVLVLVAFAATCAQPHLLLFAPLARWTAQRAGTVAPPATSLAVCIGLALCYAALDALVPRLFDAGLGYALHGAVHLRQLADVGGVALLTFVVVLVNLLVWRLWEHRRVGGPRRAALAVHLGGILVLWTAAFGYGLDRNRAVEAAIAATDRTLRVGVAQGNVPNAVRLAWARGDDRAAERQLGVYMLLTERLREQATPPELVVWPEATYPGVFQQPASTLQRGRANKFDRQVQKLQRPIVFGAYDRSSDEAQPTLYNALFAITPRYERPGTLGRVQRYHKHELLPFAETLPGVSRSAWLERNLPSLGFFGRGPGAATFEIETPSGDSVRLAPIICSEALSVRHGIEAARRGGEIILNVGSDGWFGPHGEPQFHLAIARLRSVEARRPQVRAANTGISALILPNGEIPERSELDRETILNLEVPIAALSEPLLVRWGDWFGRAALVPGLALVLAVGWRGPERGRRGGVD